MFSYTVPIHSFVLENLKDNVLAMFWNCSMLLFIDMVLINLCLKLIYIYIYIYIYITFIKNCS